MQPDDVLVLTMEAKTLDRLDTLRQMAGAESKEQLVGWALAVYDACLRCQVSGGEVALRNSVGRDEKLQLTP